MEVIHYWPMQMTMTIMGDSKQDVIHNISCLMKIGSYIGLSVNEKTTDKYT